MLHGPINRCHCRASLGEHHGKVSAQKQLPPPPIGLQSTRQREQRLTPRPPAALPRPPTLLVRFDVIMVAMQARDTVGSGQTRANRTDETGPDLMLTWEVLRSIYPTHTFHMEDNPAYKDIVVARNVIAKVGRLSRHW